MNSRIAEQIFPPNAPPVEELFAEVNGARMRYLRAGSGPPLILLHGLMGYSFSSRSRSRTLALRHGLCGRQRRTGFSDRPAQLDCSLGWGADQFTQLYQDRPHDLLDLLREVLRRRGGHDDGRCVASVPISSCEN